MSFENNNGMYMPVAPAGNNTSNCFGGDGAWWLLVLFFFAMNNGWNGFGGNTAPFVANNTANDVQRGFDQQSVMNGINNISSNLCNGFSSAEVANNGRQTALLSGMNSIQSQLMQACCDNQLATSNLNATILAENCADRAALSDGVRDILVNQNSNTQRLVDTTNQASQNIMNKICQLELDAKNEKIADLQAQLAAERSAASQNAQTQTLLRDNQAQTQALEQYLNPTPVPAYVVQNPNCCSNNFTGCGC